MFVSNVKGEVKQCQDIEMALSWHKSGYVVEVHGGAILTRAGKTKEIKKASFVDLIKHYPAWDIKVSNSKKTNFTPDAHWWQKTTPAEKFELTQKQLDAKAKILHMMGEEVEAKAVKFSPKKRRKLEKKGILKRGRKRSTKSFDRETAKAKMPLMWGNFDKRINEWKVQGVSTEIVTLYHGTNVLNVESILNTGFRLPFHRGMLGRGIYAGKLDKAKNYAKYGIILVIEIMLGNCKELDDVELIDDIQNREYDSMHINSGRRSGVFKGYLRNEEWVIRHPSQIRVIGVVIR